MRTYMYLLRFPSLLAAVDVHRFILTYGICYCIDFECCQEGTAEKWKAAAIFRTSCGLLEAKTVGVME